MVYLEDPRFLGKVDDRVRFDLVIRERTIDQRDVVPVLVAANVHQHVRLGREIIAELVR